MPRSATKHHIKPISREEFDRELIADIARFECDPLGYVLYAFPWGSGTLKDKKPRQWFVELCGRIREKLLANSAKQSGWEIVQEAIASGHGIGKSAGFAQLMMWCMSTFENTRGIVTANTDTQLRTKTWPELVKWHSMAINRDWFECTATSIYHKQHEKTWRIDAIPWSAHNTEAFAGLHNEGKRIVLIFDEASAIADPVWETAEGALTDENTQILWLCAGNPTRSSGRFRHCFNRFSHRWGTRNIDSRTVEGTNKAQIERWAKDYGEDSQFFSVRVKGQFVEADEHQLIALDWITAATMKQVDPIGGDGSQPRLRISVDCAAGGEDETVCTAVRHFDSFSVVLKMSRHSFPLAIASNSTADAAERMFLEFGGKKDRDDFVVDSLGVGVGATGELIKRGYRVITYQGGAASDDAERWRNRRVQSYMVLRNCLRDGRVAFLPSMLNDQSDFDDLTGQLCSIKTEQTEKLEDLMTKQKMKDKGIKSPDMADSLAMQYATQSPKTIPGTQSQREEPIMAIESNLWENF